MSLNEKFGRGGSNVRKLNIPHTPDVNMLQKLLSELSIATTGTQCDVSWHSGENVYTLSLGHSRQTTRANWKLYREKGTQSTLIWEYATNDVSVVHRLIIEAMKHVTSTQSQIKIPVLHEPNAGHEERRAININGNLSGKLRKLFIGTQEDLIEGNRPPSVPASNTQPAARTKAEYLDLTSGKQILQHLFIGQFGIFSHATFLFFLEREYREALEHNSTLTLVVFKVSELATNSNFPQTAMHEIAKRIKHTQRKTDILAEYNKNTFAVLLPETNTTGGISFVRRVEKALFKSELMPGLNNASIKFTFGLATLGEERNTLPALLFFAEKALARAQILGKNIVTDRDILSEHNYNPQEYLNKPVDLSETQKLVTELISGGIFTYPAFLAFLEHEYYRCIRKKRDLLIMLLKIRVFEETFDQPVNILPPPAFYEVIRRIGTLLTKRDMFAHYGHGNFIIMRSGTSVTQIQHFAKRAIQSLLSEEWLTPECPSSALRIRAQICTAKPHESDSNLFQLIAVD